VDPDREERLVRVAAAWVLLEGNLTRPEGARGIVLFCPWQRQQPLQPAKLLCSPAAQSGKARDIAGRSAEP
jgi:hypothetical protein